MNAAYKKVNMEMLQGMARLYLENRKEITDTRWPYLETDSNEECIVSSQYDAVVEDRRQTFKQ